MSGYMRTAMLLAILTGLFMLIGSWLGGTGGALIALVIAAAMNFFAYWNADKMALAAHRAKPAEGSHPELARMVGELAERAGLPKPKVYVIPSRQPNAFATGRNPENAAVAATQGLLSSMSREEVAGVMAHELAHIKNHDTLIMTIAATMGGAISFLANFALFFGGNRNGGIIGALLVMIFAPMAAMLIQMAISRSREYEADRIGAEICGQPEWLASALEKLERGAKAIDMDTAERNQASAHMFIVNPLHARKSDSLFSTHPNTKNRIAKLRQMSSSGGFHLGSTQRSGASRRPGSGPTVPPTGGGWA